MVSNILDLEGYKLFISKESKGLLHGLFVANDDLGRM